MFTCQDEEAGITFNKYKLFIDTRFRDAKSFKYIKYYFNYGRSDHKKFKEWKLDKFGTKLLLTGSPKFDILEKEINQSNKKKFIKRLNLKKKYILITTSIGFPLSIRRFSDIIYARTFNLRNKKLKENITNSFFNLTTQSIYNLKEAINLINYLCVNLKNYSIVLKTHPNEIKEDWIKILDKNKNLFVIKNYFTQSLINNAELIIQNGSSTAIESTIANNHTVSHKSKIFKIEINKTFPNSFSKNFNTKEKLLNFIKFKLSSNRLFSSKKEKLKNYVENIYEKNSYLKIVEIWKNININTKSNNGFKKDYNIKSYLKNFIKNSIGLNRSKIYDVMSHKYPDINMEVINNLKEDLSRKNSKYKKIKIRPLTSRIMKISKN